MRILLLSMPDSFEHTPVLAIRMPNGALASLAGNVDPQHQVAIADLVLAQSSVRQTVERLVRDLRPELVGLSVMTFQRATARRIIAFIRSIDPAVRVVVGGYDPSLAPDAWMHPDIGVDFIVRGEADLTFRDSGTRARGRDAAVSGRRTLVPDWNDVPVHAPATGDRHRGRDDQAPEPRRPGPFGYTMLGRDVDVVETSRGCTYDCSFCSIIEMRGRNFHRFPISRVIDDIRDARNRGARVIFFVDDNITIDVPRFEALCRAIVEAGLDDVDYIVQGMTAPIAAHGATLGPLMRRAGFRYVFLGIENILDEDLAFLKARAKNSRRDEGRPRQMPRSTRSRSSTRTACWWLAG